MKHLDIRLKVSQALRRVEWLSVIQEGFQATIYDLEINQKRYAIKCFNENQDDLDKECEIEALQKMNSNYVVNYYCHDQRNLDWILLEKFGFCNLQEYLTNYYLNKFEERIIFSQIVQGCIDIQKAGFYHCDLKTSNILFDPETLQIKICDFGFAQKIDSTNQVIKGTFGYFAPEQLQGKPIKHSEKQEVFALGVILFQLLNQGQFPYKNQNDCSQWLALIDKKWDIFWKNTKLTKEWQLIIEKLLNPHPIERPNFQDIQTIFL